MKEKTRAKAALANKAIVRMTEAEARAKNGGINPDMPSRLQEFPTCNEPGHGEPRESARPGMLDKFGYEM